MSRLVVVSFLVMGWAYYELSGGADFVPEPWPETLVEAPAVEGITNDDVEAAIAAANELPAAPEETLPAEEVRLVRTGSDPDPATPVVEPSDAAEVTFVSLSDSLDGTPLTAADPAPQPVASGPVASAPAAPEFRSVDATRLNVRAGPSTADGVVGQLTRGEQVTLVSSNGDGWSLIRLEGDGLEGWVANRFLVEN